ncbi:MAG: Gx transporter family protein [Clostridia bacterium]|nr:Gx transporter family protein [Clostridia bacterium]
MAKKISLYSLLTVFALLVSYLEGIAFSFIPVPAFKLGLANCVCMLLFSRKEYAAAITVNLSRILLSALLFGNFYSLAFSLSGAIFSSLAVLLLLKFKCFSFAGISAAGGAFHNFGQLAAAALLNTAGLLYLLPLLFLVGAVLGFITGMLLEAFSKKYGNLINKIT